MGVILNGLRGRRSIWGRRIMVAGFPQTQMPQELCDVLIILDERNDFHKPLTLTSRPGSEEFSLPVDDLHVLGCPNVHDFSV